MATEKVLQMFESVIPRRGVLSVSAEGRSAESSTLDGTLMDSFSFSPSPGTEPVNQLPPPINLLKTASGKIKKKKTSTSNSGVHQAPIGEVSWELEELSFGSGAAGVYALVGAKIFLKLSSSSSPGQSECLVAQLDAGFFGQQAGDEDKKLKCKWILGILEFDEPVIELLKIYPDDDGYEWAQDLELQDE